ncbi:carboxypeptidase B [Helicoverpa armigera]|uniref:carboxypeptidase B n=1 Tax=Helicoverpa armigera TaxID=29058 RepID=UPI003083E601
MILYYCFLVVLSFVAAKNEEYRGYRVYNIEVDTELQQENIGLLRSDLIDFWRKPSYKYGVTGKAMVPPSHFNWFEEQLEKLGLARDVYIEDVYEYLNKADIEIRSSREEIDDDDNNGDDDDDEQEKTPFDIKRYHRYDDILTHLRELQAKYQDTTTKVELVEFGVTEQNRPLVYIKVTRNNNNIEEGNNAKEERKEKPIVLIEAAINPRDWITIPAALNVLENILKEQKYVEDLEWMVIPVLNPDGYEYTHTNLRLWQKTRSTNSHLAHICPGVNINRNFDLDWLHFDSSSSPCSHLFAGTEPFSEIETQMIQSLIEEYGTRIKLYISLQNNGGYISYPWNYEKAASGMFRQHHLLGLDMIKTMNDAYNLDAGSVIFDRASGTSSDYAREKEILYTFNIDVVHGENGVLIPEEDIGGIVDDVWKAVSIAANEMIRLYS